MMFVIIPTDDPDVQMAYQVASEAAAEELARELVHKHGGRAVLARPYSITRTEISFNKMVRG